ncbi:EAL domain-containing protein [Aeromonas jandaei]|uniref:EAL domain-containing protein n=1 Tax=Aeromonas jandaei TaxID=650 RepID=UPI001ADDD3AC|nr:EAL domain-containing protein [Aeromonas jandaei]QTL94362.1 EAL domain protein [Aeromonas jandaei]
MSTYKVMGEVLAIRLEPIVDLVSNETIGYEALSRVVQYGNTSQFDYECFFSRMTPCDLIGVLNRQLEIYQKWHSQHPEIYKGKMLFVNARVDLLDDDFFVPMFIPFSRTFKIAIELNASDCTIKKSHRKKIEQLSALGISLWIDDYSGEDNIARSCWGGVKIDKNAFWFSYKNNFNPIRYLGLTSDATCRKLTDAKKPVLLAEGIECDEHRSYAIANGFRLGQGYYWSALS